MRDNRNAERIAAPAPDHGAATHNLSSSYHRQPRTRML